MGGRSVALTSPSERGHSASQRLRNSPSLSAPPPRRFPTTAAGLDEYWALLRLIRALTLTERSPPAMADALVAAGLVPALVSLLGRWEGLKTATYATTAAATGVSPSRWTFYVLELICAITGLVSRFRRKVCSEGMEGGGGGERPSFGVRQKKKKKKKKKAEKCICCGSSQGISPPLRTRVH